MDREVTLKELLDAREKRAAYQKKLLDAYKEDGGVLVSVTLNIPGPIKTGPAYRRVMSAAMEELGSAVTQAGGKIRLCERKDLVTGPEGYLLIKEGLSCREVKSLTVEIEDASLPGRLFDMDVMDEKGCVRRKDLGLSNRKCLLCQEDAKVCARSRKHGIKELLAEIDRIIQKAEI